MRFTDHALPECSNPGSFPIDELRAAATRDGITQPYYLASPSRPLPDTAWLLLPGGNGARHIKVVGNGSVVLSNNFIVRTSPMYVTAGFAVAILGPPSDFKLGMSDAYRTSAAQTADVLALMEELGREGVQNFYLAATSRGTLSAVSLGAAIADARLRGIILTSSIEHTRHLSAIDFSTIRVPVLQIHHRDDGCDACTFEEALRTRDELARHTPVTFRAVSGGSTPPNEDPCMPISVHGFFGIEAEVAGIMIEWVRASGQADPQS
jgi:hypothetical protein